jgi:hypothetical protein
MPVIDQLSKSTLSLQGNGFNPQSHNSAWGFVDSTNNLDPAQSKLQYTFDVNSIPNVKIKDFNKNGKSTVLAETRLDELDPRAPKLIPTGVVSQAYKSSKGNSYKEKGPRDGRY